MNHATDYSQAFAAKSQPLMLEQAAWITRPMHSHDNPGFSDGGFEIGMVICVESYVGEVGAKGSSWKTWFCAPTTGRSSCRATLSKKSC